VNGGRSDARLALERFCLHVWQVLYCFVIHLG
jgi:hypothetical protein